MPYGQRMSPYTRTLTGEAPNPLTVRDGQHTLVTGAVRDAVVGRGTVLNVVGAIAGEAHVEYGGTLLLAGALAGTLTIAEGGKAAVQGVLTGRIENAGELAIDAFDHGGEITGPGAQFAVADLTSELRAMLPTVTTTRE
jgi:hypothetical protein